MNEQELNEWLKNNPQLSIDEATLWHDKPTAAEEQQRKEATAAKQKKSEHYFNLIYTQCDFVNLPLPVAEYRFDPERKWRIDVAWPNYKIALEIEGGIWQQTSSGRSSGHANPVRFLRDMEKYNAMTVQGWSLIRCTPEQVENETALIDIIKAFESANWQVMIRDFHSLFNHRIKEKPNAMTRQEIKWRTSFLAEEVREYVTAETLEKRGRELADIIYFAVGSAVAEGIPIDDILRIVHQSNMSKLWDDGLPHYDENTNKVKKPPNWVDGVDQKIKEIMNESKG